MTLQGYVFDRAKVTAKNDASLISALNNDVSMILKNRGNGMAVTTSGLTATIDTGWVLICGRPIAITEPEEVTIPANSNGFLVITVDLSFMNESSGIPGTDSYQFINNQLKAEFVTSITTDDLNNDGLLYTFNLGAISSGASDIVFAQNKVAWGMVGSDWNAIKNSGTFTASASDNPANAPVGYGSKEYEVDVFRNGNHARQHSVPFDATLPPYYRTSTNGGNSWTAWRSYI